jgi:hypothetical protein
MLKKILGWSGHFFDCLEGAHPDEGSGAQWTLPHARKRRAVASKKICCQNAVQNFAEFPGAKTLKFKK